MKATGSIQFFNRSGLVACSLPHLAGLLSFVFPRARGGLAWTEDHCGRVLLDLHTY